MAEERDSKELQSGTLVIGLGRFGSAVAVTQDQLGYEILAVEKNPARVQAFAGRFPPGRGRRHVQGCAGATGGARVP